MTARLTGEGRADLRKHPEYGWAVLRNIPGFERPSLLVLHHRERFDSSSCPARLACREIPLGGGVVSVVDALDTMLSSPSYRKCWSKKCPDAYLPAPRPSSIPASWVSSSSAGRS